MTTAGLIVGSRYAYPPNSFSLCGPEKHADLAYYTATGAVDVGTKEILVQFQTFYPYLRLIAGANNIKDPFDTRVVEAYWMGNGLLQAVSDKSYLNFLIDDLQLKKTLSKKKLHRLIDLVTMSSIPSHTFHVLSIYMRTGFEVTAHTLASLNACLINWGQVVEKTATEMIVTTQQLDVVHDSFQFVSPVKRKVRFQGMHDSVAQKIERGDWITYHWGYVCQKLTLWKLKQLISYTQLALDYVNQKPPHLHLG